MPNYLIVQDLEGMLVCKLTEQSRREVVVQLVEN